MWSRWLAAGGWLVAALLLRARAELFTATADVEPLLDTQRRVADRLQHYIDAEQQRLRLLNSHLDRYKVEHMKAMEDVPNYLGNPINAFTLIKRLTTDLAFIEDSIKNGTEYTKKLTLYHEDVKYPTLEDLTGAAQALTRLQDTYHLKVNDLSEGKLNGIIDSQHDEAVSTPMSAGDCFELGRALYDERDYKNCLAWMMEARRKYEEDGGPRAHRFTLTDILEYISFSHYMLGDARAAVRWSEELLALQPEHPRARRNLPLFRNASQESGEQGARVQRETYMWSLPEDERRTYEALCRGELAVPVRVASRLRCRYLTETHPFLRLAPIKMEQVYIKPDVLVFHEVMTDEESEHIKKLAKPKFDRATVHDPGTGQLIAAPFRISKSSRLHDGESPVVARLSRRVAHFTGLNLASAEDLQVANYGIGGHYEPHYDFARKEERGFGRKFGGNRIATVIFYMSEVGQGGATVFPALGLSVRPAARSAAFWLNLHPSGEGDLATKHAACPVLRGSKWVCNKWLHQAGQELIRPCDLHYQPEGIVGQIPEPVPRSFE